MRTDIELKRGLGDWGLSAVYEGNTVKVIETDTDPTLMRWKKSTLDVLGRLIQVTEPNPSGGADVETYYDSHSRRTAVYRKPASWANNDPGQTTQVSWDTAVNGWGRVASVSQGGMVESYEYTVGGLVTKKRLGFQDYDTPLEAVYSWNQAGQMASMKYPDVYNADGSVAATGRTLNYQYSYLGPPSTMTDPALPWGSQTVASGVWNAAGQMTQLSVRKPDATMDVENFTFNERGQLLQQSGRGVNIEYRYSATDNDGRLVSRKDNVSGEEVVYQYDLLGRLTSAATTGTGGWGLSWTFDGFGNRLTQSVTKGTAPVVNLTVNAATNRISSPGFVYDANGNQTQWPVGAGTASAGYDAQNRMTSVSTANGTEFYGYSSANQRILIFRASGTETLFYGLGGELLGIYARTQKANGRYYVSSVIGTRVWFAGRMIESNGNAVVRDRLGSVEKNGTTLTHYYPYGEEQGGATAGNKEKFGTYTRDAVSGLDYAWNRYYSSTWGRFTSADPSAPGDPSDPSSWNLYAYVEGDPINFNDPEGLTRCGDLVNQGLGRRFEDLFLAYDERSYLALVAFHEAGPMYASDASNPDSFLREQALIVSALMNRWEMNTGVIKAGYDSDGNPVSLNFGGGASLIGVILNAAGNNQDWGIFTNGRLRTTAIGDQKESPWERVRSALDSDAGSPQCFSALTAYQHAIAVFDSNKGQATGIRWNLTDMAGSPVMVLFWGAYKSNGIPSTLPQNLLNMGQVDPKRNKWFGYYWFPPESRRRPVGRPGSGGRPR